MTLPKMTTTNDVRGKLVGMLMEETDPHKAAALSNAIFDSLQKEIACGFIIGKDSTTGADIRANVGIVAVYFEQTPTPPTQETPPNQQMKRSIKHRRN